MSSAFTRTRRVAPLSTIAVGAALLVAGLGSPAMASASCPSGSTLVAGNACEVVFTSTPSGVWTPPVGVTRLDALLVGAGGLAHGTFWYGGGGGDVRIVELASSGDVTIVVGAEASSDYSTTNDTSVAQGTTTEVAEGGRSPVGDIGGYSGNGNAPGPGANAGSGAGGVSVLNNGGPGVIVGDITGAEQTLFAGVTDCYGGGGAARDGVATCGGGFAASTSSTGATQPVANSGGGGAAWYSTASSDYVAQNGAAGKVVLRFELPELPATGQSDFTGAMTAGLGAMLVGAGAVAFGIRRRKV